MRKISADFKVAREHTHYNELRRKMKLRAFFGSFTVLLFATAGCTDTKDLGSGDQGRQGCGATNCTLQPDTICSDLLGRASDFASPQLLPPEAMLDNTSLTISGIALDILLRHTQSPPACYEYSLHYLCLVAVPPCNHTTQTPLMLCPQTCDAYEKLISSGLCNYFIDIIIETLNKSDIQHFRELAPIFKAFNCSDPATYFQNDTREECADTTCTSLFSAETEELILSRQSLFSCDVSTGSFCEVLFPGAFSYSIQIPGRAESEGDVFDILTEVSPLLDRTCSDWLTLVACNYLHPSCTNNGKQMTFCDEQCSQLDQFIEEHCNLKNVLLSDFSVTNNSFLTRFVQFSCSDPQTYLIPGVPVDNTTCYDIMDLLSTVITATDPGQSSSVPTGIIVGCVVGSILAIVVTAVVTIVYVRVRLRHKWRTSGVPQEWLRHFSLSRRLSRATQQREMDSLSVNRRRRVNVSVPSNNTSEGGRSDSGNDHGSEDGVKVVSLSPAERQDLEKQFAGSLVEFSSLSMGRCVGEGAFSKVYAGNMSIEGTITVVAIKTIKRIDSEEQLSAFLAESVIMKDFKHPHILGLLGVCFDAPDGSPYIVLPFMANGSVKTYLKEKRVRPTNFDACPVELKVAELVHMCMDITEGMKYLTDNKFVHRDLAARNCMVNEEGAVLVGDFGLAKDVYAADYYRSSVSTKLPVKWMPPETLNDGISNEKTDVWSYGVTCWEVFSLGRSPYPGIENHEVLQYISNGRRLKKPTLCPDKLYPLILQCWNSLPEDRPTFAELGDQLKDYWDEEHLYIVQSFTAHHTTPAQHPLNDCI